MSGRSGKNILFIENDENILNSISFILESNGFTMYQARSIEEALADAGRFSVDLVLFDTGVGMGMDETASRIKKNKRLGKAFLVALSESSLEDDMVRALETWADDYIVKPVRPRVLLARIRAILRRKTVCGMNEDVFQYGQLEIHTAGREVFVEGKPVSLTRTEFDILALLVRQPNTVFSRAHIIDAIRGEGYFITERAIDFQVCGLRKKLGSCGDCIETVRSLGYKFRAT